MGIPQYSRRYSKANQQQKVVRDLSATAFVDFFAWFWWFDLDQFKPTPCGTYGYYDELDLYGSLQMFIRVCSVLTHGLGVKIESNLVFTVFKIQALRSSTDSFKFELIISLEYEFARRNLSVDTGLLRR